MPCPRRATLAAIQVLVLLQGCREGKCSKDQQLGVELTVIRVDPRKGSSKKQVLIVSTSDGWKKNAIGGFVAECRFFKHRPMSGEAERSCGKYQVGPNWDGLCTAEAYDVLERGWRNAGFKAPLDAERLDELPTRGWAYRQQIASKKAHYPITQYVLELSQEQAREWEAPKHNLDGALGASGLATGYKYWKADKRFSWVDCAEIRTDFDENLNNNQDQMIKSVVCPEAAASSNLPAPGKPSAQANLLERSGTVSAPYANRTAQALAEIRQQLDETGEAAADTARTERESRPVFATPRRADGGEVARLRPAEPSKAEQPGDEASDSRRQYRVGARGELTPAEHFTQPFAGPLRVDSGTDLAPTEPSALPLAGPLRIGSGGDLAPAEH